MKWIIALFICLMSYVSIQSSQAVSVSTIVGTQSQCDTALSGCNTIPLSLTTLCTASCPIRTSPSYASSTEFWAAIGSATGSCARSTDGGVTWPACTTQPFSTGANEVYAGASDGSVIGATTTTGPNTCTISRSTNNGTSWSVVFTQANDCNPATAEGQYLFCLSDGRCEWATKGASTFRIFRSSNNGASWTAGETGDSFCAARDGGAWNGSVGIIPPQDPGCGGGNIAKAFVASGDVWTESTAWTGAQGSCWGSVIYNNLPRAICFAAVNYTMRDSTGGLVANLTLPNVNAGLDSGGPSVSIGTNILYVFATSTGPTRLGVWVSRDNLASFNFLGGFTGTSGLRGGNAFYANGCVYINGDTPSTFAKVC
jgi:hypothetical protein